MRQSDKVLLAYGRCFSSEDGKEVLKDLHLSINNRPLIDLHSPYPIDPLKVAALDGQRQLYLRLMQAVESASILAAQIARGDYKDEEEEEV